ncbi:MAG: hypothetical protein J6V90_06325 [Treponema sp.]|nr:hypothetical protein [Treponema sp.]
MKKNNLAVFALCLCALFFSCSNSSDSPIVPPLPIVTASDWLFLMYLDADDPSINDSLYENMREIEYSLTQIRNLDGTPKPGYPSVTVAVLWDGISENLKASSNYLHPDGALYELGADYELKWVQYSGFAQGIGKVYLTKDGDNYSLGDAFKVGANTKDLTLTALNWLKKEPDMADESTLEGFLKWAKARYISNNVVLCLNDHGAGTHKETKAEGLMSQSVSSSLCTDATDGGNKLLTCKNIKDALSAAGYAGAQKPKILWNDECLQSTAEILYNYAGCAEYLAASPNASVSNNYTRIFTSLKSGMTALDLGKIIASAYYERYGSANQYFQPIENNRREMRASGYSMFAWSFLSLNEQKAAALKEKVDAFAAALITLKTNDETAFNSIYTNYIKQDYANLQNCKGLAYPGTFAFLNDLGWLAKEVAADTTNNLPDEVCDAATEIKTLLKHGDDKLIVYAWGGKRAKDEAPSETPPAWADVTQNQMYLTGKKDYLTGESVAVENGNDDDIYGLTIVGSQRMLPNGNPASDGNNAVKNYYDWTGFSEKWGDVIEAWRTSGL